MKYGRYEQQKGGSGAEGEPLPAPSKSAYRKVKRHKKEKVEHLGLKLFSGLLIILMAVVLCVIWTLDSIEPETWEEEGMQGVMNSLEEIRDALPTIPLDFGREEQNENEVTGVKYSISTSSEYATQAGAAILEAGGNAVDAAIAISYNLAVSEPYASGLGGGGCMVIYDPKTEAFTFYNYGSEAPQSGRSWLTLVPGFVSGMEAIRADFATMSYEQLLQSAIECCDGVVINEISALRIKNAASVLSKNSPFFNADGYLKEGDVMVQPELKQTLQRLLEEGPESFYTGSIAQDITAATSLTMDDMAAYETIKTEAVVGTYADYTIGAAAAPFSGATLVQMLKMADILQMPDPDEDNGKFLADLLKISQTSQYERIHNVYDLRFAGSSVDQNNQVSDAYVAQLLNLDVSDFMEEEECEDTTGFTVIDKDGMVVACTNTLSSFFGCKKSVDGFYMNNTGYLFGSGVNTYQAGKRPRTHISPAILVSDDEVIAVASPGGNLITKVLANVVLDVCRFGEDPQTAVNKQRVVFLHGNVLYYETGYDTPLMAKASGSDYYVVPYSYHPYFGSVAMSGCSTEDGYFAVEDVRRCGNALASNG